jgi:hypothetical protein
MRGWLTKFIAPDGTLTASGAHEFCYRKRLPKTWSVALSDLAEGANTLRDPDILRWLARTRLVNDAGMITALGKLKLVESRKLSEQCAHLQVPLEVVHMEKDSRISTEGHAITHLQPNFPDHLILHDEHVSVETVLYACLMAHYCELVQYLSPQDRSRFEDRRYLIGFDLWNFDIDTIEYVCIKIMETSAVDFDRGFSLAVDLHNEAQQGLASRGLSRGLNFYQRLFDGYGKALLCDLARLRVSQPYLSFPDLCIIGQHGVSFIEVKAKDKLSFNQIYTFELLKELKLRHLQLQDLGVMQLNFRT